MRKFVYLFPGQGSQYVGMGKDFFQQSHLARQRFEEASEVLGIDLKRLCFEGSAADLKQTMNAQPAIVLVSVIAYELAVQQFGHTPAYFAGHSLGEYSALICANTLSFSEGIRLVRQRGLLMQQAIPDGRGTMVAVMGLKEKELAEICYRASSSDQPVVIACNNALEQQVISGHTTSVAKVVKELEEMSVRSQPLQVSGPFHSPMLDATAHLFEEHLRLYSLQYPATPVLSNVNATPHKREDLFDNLVTQMVRTVRWHDTIQYLIRENVNCMIELGPGKQLSKMLEHSGFDGLTRSISDMASLNSCSSIFDSLPTTSLELERERIEKCFAAAIIAKNHNHDASEYQLGVLYTSQQLKQLLAQAPDYLSSEQLEAAKSWIVTIVQTKKISQQEQDRIIQTLYPQSGRLGDCSPLNSRH